MPIHSLPRTALFVAFATLTVPSLAEAQLDHLNILPGPTRLDVSASGGFLLPTDWSDLVLLGSISPATGVLEQVLVRDVVVDPGPVYDVTVTYWEGRYGFRAHGGLARSCLALGRTCSGFTSLGEPIGEVNVDTYMYDVGGSIGLIEYRRDLWAWPYAFFGVGAVTYNLDQSVGPPLTFISRGPTGGGDIVIIREEPETLLISVDELGLQTQFALTFGLGADFRIPVGPASLGARLEVSDNLHGSPLDLTVASLDVPGIAGRQTTLDFKTVHNLRAAVGLVFQFGR
jgi:hypothetical protein